MSDKDSVGKEIDTFNEERLIPLVRSASARKLARQGFRTTEIARVLRVTQPAVTQYLSGKRGASIKAVQDIDRFVDPLVENLARKIRSGSRAETAELLEAARQISVVSNGKVLVGPSDAGKGSSKTMDMLRGRLRLELDAAEKYLELANRTSDDYTKLLFRMIAGDSIRHGDVVSQLISWLESGGRSGGSVPDEAVLRSMAALEDSASEASLTKEVEVDHPIARLLLRWIDLDESKHDRMVRGLIALDKHSRKPRPR